MNLKKIIISISICTSFATWAVDFNVVDFGARADGRTLDTPAIQKAINECSQKGGGVVILSQGDYLTGTINLLNNVELHFERGARLIATTDLSAYQRHNDGLAGLFYTEDASNVAITGHGIVFGQGMEFMYPDSAKRISGPVLDLVRQGKNLREVKSGIGDGPLHPRDRFHQMIIFSNCTDVRLSDFTCIDSPYWCFLIVHCDRVKIQGLTIDNNLLIPNSDGLDIISSSNVNVSDCYFSCGDDSIVLAGYDWHFGDPGFKRISRPSRNINITNCILRSRSSAIRIGGWDQNPMINYNLSNITIFDSNAGINVQIRDYAGIENLNFSNINIETRLCTGDWWGNGEPIRISAMKDRDSQPGAIHNVNFTNITCNSENSVYVYAEPGCTIDGLNFTNFEMNMKQGNLANVTGGNIDMRPARSAQREFFATDIAILHIENASNVCLNSGILSWDGSVKDSYFKNALDAINITNLTINGVTANASPANPTLPAMVIKNCVNVKQ
jgi:polygalacturonase